MSECTESGLNKLETGTNLPGLFVQSRGLITEGVGQNRINSGSNEGTYMEQYSREIVADHKWIFGFSGQSL